MKIRVAYLSFCIFLISLVASAQKGEIEASIDTSIISDTKVEVEREIRLERNSKSEDVILSIERGVDRFELVINTSVTAGNLKIKVYDPRGNSQGTFSIGKELSAEKSERVQQSIRKSLEHPQSGDWKVSIMPVDVTGTVTISTSLMYWDISAAHAKPSKQPLATRFAFGG